MTVAVATTKTGFAKPYYPVSTSGMLHFATDVEALFNDILNGVEAFERQLFTTASQKTIASGAITAPTLALHTVAAESGTADDLDTITASNNFFVVLKAKAGDTITIRYGTGNISTPSSGSMTLTGNRIALLWCLGSQWALVGTKRLGNNLTATSDPGSGDDVADGYGVGSLWVNLTLDRTWLCLDATTGTAIWKPIHQWKNGYSVRAAAATTIGEGVTANIGGTPSGQVSANDATNTFMQLTAAATAANYNDGGGGFPRPAYNPVYESIIKTGSDITNQILWIGLQNGVTNGNTMANSAINFRFSTTAPDTGWVPVMNNGGTQTEGTAIGTVQASTAYKLRIRVDHANSRAFYSVNDSAEQMLNTNYPSAATDMSAIAYIAAQGGASRDLAFSRHEVRW